MPREIITLQLGPLANYTGAHFWNLQDEALGLEAREGRGGTLEDVLFAWTEERGGALKYHPRAVILDASGATGGVSFSPDARHAAAAAAGGAAATWGGGVEVLSAAAVPKSAFVRQLELQAGVDFDAEPESAVARHQAALEAAARQLDSLSLSAPGPPGATASGAASNAASSGANGGGGGGVRYWTDYLKVHLHPRSAQALPGVWQGVSAFDGYGAAEGALQGARGVVEAAADAARWWAEQCDSLQGLQVFSDDLSGFGGLSRSLLDELREELPGAKILYFSVRPPAADHAEGPGGGGGGGGTAMSALSDALACAELSERASLYMPLCLPPGAAAALPLLRLPPGGGAYRETALLAAAADTLTLPLRLSGATSALGAPVGATDMHSWVQLLTAHGGANFAAAALQLPAGGVTSDGWAAQRRGDARVQPGGGGGGGEGTGGEQSGAGGGGGNSGGGSSGEGYGLSTLRHAPVLAPAAAARLRLDPGESLAESIVLRGALLAGGAAAAGGGAAGDASGGGEEPAALVAAAAAALDAALRAEPRRRCVVHRCVSSQPLAVPLPFPGLFSPAVSAGGGVVAGWSPGRQAAASAAAAGGRDGRHVISCPVLTRVAATSEFDPWLRARAAGLRRAARGAAGRAAAEAWGFGGAELDEARERLERLAGSYSEAASGSDLD